MIKKADLVVGIPSYNEADNIGFVVEQVDRGLRKYFSSHKSCIINVDNYSPDNTKGAFLEAPCLVPKIYISTPPQRRGKGRNFYNLFKKIKEVGAKAVVVVDADLKSITPEWIKYFLDPVVKQGYDFCTPLYSRHKYDATITNNICYPLTYALLGKNIRQPIGGDYSFSRKLNDYYLSRKWYRAVRAYGIDIFITTHAILDGFKICQVGLGAKIHKPSAPKLGSMFSQVVDTFFRILIDNKDYLNRVGQIQKPPIKGKKKLGPPQSLVVDDEEIKQKALLGFKENKKSLEKHLSKEVFNKVKEIYEREEMVLDMDLWSRVVYDLLKSFDKAKNKGQVVEAMKPLYFGRVASFIKQTRDWSRKRAEAEIQKQAQCFFKSRKYFNIM